MDQEPPPTPANGTAGAGAQTSRWSTLIATNAAKLVGIYTFYTETQVRPTARDSVLAICLAFVLGAQATENALLRLIDRIFAKD
jgi:NADH:ubiquinone oxidoreductase subunit E